MPRYGQLIQAANADIETGSKTVKERERRQHITKMESIGGIPIKESGLPIVV